MAATTPVVNLIAPDPAALEGTSTASFTLVRQGPTASPLDVHLKIAGTATNGFDYQAISSPVTIPAGMVNLGRNIPDRDPKSNVGQSMWW